MLFRSPQSNRTTKRFGNSYPPGNLKKSVAKGTEIGSNKRGSRKQINTVVDKARDRVVSQRNSSTTAKYEKQMQKFIQKQIDKLSK